MAKTLIEIDEDLLAYAAEVLGTNSKRATVDAALRASVRQAALDRIIARARADARTPEELDAERAAAWR